MGNLMLGVAFMAYCFALFSYSTATLGAYRAFYGLFSTAAETSVVRFNEFGEAVSPHFDLSRLKETVGLSLEECLAKICRYEYRVAGANPDSKTEEEGSTKAVILSLTCFHWSVELILDKKAFFSILEVSDGN